MEDTQLSLKVKRGKGMEERRWPGWTTETQPRAGPQGREGDLQEVSSCTWTEVCPPSYHPSEGPGVCGTLEGCPGAET